ncbi:trypsin-like peptidase domain-containing protein [Polyangium sp. 15x6]|uniref:trypsin-like peptidase domain-containing protein n=1 Tax=Polyangium sp. 15x6 TaxID=3042687 RepID=UPI00249C6219|nr:trypsin-like peptidase domain-containing protein [Polyangium sp. 15x6]MDI3287636.1 trypsin-like peptidase domain-containing protein [Polyangium sp. 15x6]
MRPRCMLASMLVMAGLGSASSLASAQVPPPRPKAPPPPALPAPARGLPSAAEVRALGDTFVAVAEKTSPAVVQIDVTVSSGDSSAGRWFRADATTRGMGSGVIFSADGAILTNNHVIEDARAINVRLKDGRTLSARVAGRDPATDLAVLRVDATNLPVASFADSDAARVGEWVVAIGSPFGLGHTVTTGVLSAKGRGGVGMNAIEDYLQTDASINPGNSGGPLVNLDGQVLGINTMIVSKGQGIGLAVPSNIARRVATQILKTGRVMRAWIGIGIQDLTPQLAAEIPSAPTSGALVNTVVAGGPAQKAHLEPGDIVTKIGARTIADAQDVIRELFLHDDGEVLAMEVIRSGKRYQTKVTLEAKSETSPPALPVERKASSPQGLGITLRDVEGDGSSTLAQIVAVSPDSPADRAGLKRGDVVLEADFARLPTSADVQKAAQDGRLLLRVRRDKATFYTAVR